MSFRRSSRWVLVGMPLVAWFSTGASCYRAEVDLSRFRDEPPPAGGSMPSVGGAGEAGQPLSGAPAEVASGGSAGEVASGGSAGDVASGGSGGEPACEMPPDDPAQYQCQEDAPTKAMCDEIDAPGWDGCHGGGCAICAQVLVNYPSYLARHPCCILSDDCEGQAPLKCSPLCPPPTEFDKREPCDDLKR